MKNFLILAGLAALASCGTDETTDPGAPPAEPLVADTDGAPPETPAEPPPAPVFQVVETWGAGVAAGEVTPVSQILADPEAYVGKTVRIEGTAVAVCAKRGCWFRMASDLEGQALRFKVEDGEMVFPPTLVGERVRAEGVFTANELDLETTLQVCEAEAEKAGEAFDPESVTECRTVYQVSGTGVVQLAVAP